MSKITLEPNASGAGTFTLAAPNSNTNRTLTLPDEAGKILSTGNNDPAEVFKQSNILGTVSESGGVPTGAIIERDTNANGEYVKYADGTLICWQRNISADWPSTRTLPASFVDTNYNILVGLSATATSDTNHSGKGRAVSTSTVEIGITLPSGFSNLSGQYIAIGRWY